MPVLHSKSNRTLLILFCIASFLLAASRDVVGQQKVKLDPEDVVAKHLKALGTSDSFAAATERRLEGKSNFRDIRNSMINVSGSAEMTSDTTNFGMFLVFSTNPTDFYRQDKIEYNGKKVSVPFASTTSRSPMGQFLYEFPEVIKSGLFGGTLNAEWAILDRKNKIKKLDFQGFEKVDGIDLIVLRCTISGGTNLRIKLYFHPETYAHVQTIYAGEIQPPTTLSDEGRVSSIRHVFIEHFAGHTPISGLVIPITHRINYTFESPLRNGQYEWTMNFSRFEFKKAPGA